jgi:deoxycytidylate deaminase
MVVCAFGSKSKSLLCGEFCPRAWFLGFRAWARLRYRGSRVVPKLGSLMDGKQSGSPPLKVLRRDGDGDDNGACDEALLFGGSGEADTASGAARNCRSASNDSQAGEDASFTERILRLVCDLRSSVSHHQQAVRGNIVAVAVRPPSTQVVAWGYVRSLLQESARRRADTAPVANAPQLSRSEPRGGVDEVDGIADDSRSGSSGEALDSADRAAGASSKFSRRNSGVATDVHAEADLVASAARDGVALRGCTVYVSSICCIACFRLLVAAGVRRIVHPPPPNPGFMIQQAPHCAALASRHGVVVDMTMVLPPHRPPVRSPEELGLVPKECRGWREGDPLLPLPAAAGGATGSGDGRAARSTDGTGGVSGGGCGRGGGGGGGGGVVLVGGRCGGGAAGDGAGGAGGASSAGGASGGGGEGTSGSGGDGGDGAADVGAAVSTAETSSERDDAAAGVEP